MGSVTILGAGSALPTFQNSPASQIVELCDKSFLVDCGEGAQLTFRKMKMKTARLYSIFISHLHGDHCFGLIGLISTFNLMKRLQPLHIYAHADLQRLLQPLLDYHCADLQFDLIFHAINPKERSIIFEDRTVSVETIPLKHKVPTCGFLFCEHHRHKTTDGSYTRITQKKYAYCSDTMFSPKIILQIDGVETLFHEATYTNELEYKCKQTMHSTAKQAATIAKKAHVGKLIIGHFSSRIDDQNIFLKEAKEIFDNTILAKEQMKINL